MCKRVIRAVRAVLEEEAYRSHLTFEVYPWDDEHSAAARELYDFGFERHGLVVLDADRKLLTLRPGHSYGAPEIREDFDQALGR